tara:strand:+ start:409 stop:1080 length:672 start_codon:yes stop_codon:yes gene_type:complete
MHQSISRNIFIYLFIFLFLVTANNTKIFQNNILKITGFEIWGLNDFENKKLISDLEYLKNENIFYLNKKKLYSKINSEKIVEKFTVFKKYPSKIIIEIEKTSFLAVTKKDNKNFYVGSNGSLIEIEEGISDLPFIFGDVDIEEFLKFKKIIDKSKFNYNSIDKLYYFKSKRWDIKTKSGLIIKLPSKEVDYLLNILPKLSQSEEFKDINVIDLRQKNQIIING